MELEFLPYYIVYIAICIVIAFFVCSKKEDMITFVVASALFPIAGLIAMILDQTKKKNAVKSAEYWKEEWARQERADQKEQAEQAIYEQERAFKEKYSDVIEAIEESEKLKSPNDKSF